jgi:hypothetical protein
MKCPGCGEWFDIRDLGQVLAHAHEGETLIDEGDSPPSSGPPLN